MKEAIFGVVVAIIVIGLYIRLFWLIENKK